MNPRLNLLQPYPFEKLRALKAVVEPNHSLPHIALSIGEPKHEPPEFVLRELTAKLPQLAKYPSTAGLPELQGAIAAWAQRRFKLGNRSLSEANVLPVSGTREALFSFTQACVDGGSVLMPNPFYQIYEGAALLAGAEPVFLNCTEDNGFIPDFDAVSPAEWQRCQLLFLCSPGNPTGAVLDSSQLQKLIALADRYDFVIASDECYSELYFDEEQPPTGLLQACAEMGRDDYSRCVVFHSLSKRSNLPGLRSGFVAGDARLLEKYLLYRTYHGCALPVPTQYASIAAWQDEAHVKANRDLYRQKFDAVLNILGDVLPVKRPDAGFYLWPKTPIADTDFAQQLFASQNVTVLPGRYLARPTAQGNPGENRLRLALVASTEECIEAAQRIKKFVQAL
jgi:N-succinyldiaminopimelate aminotransferase